MQQKKLMHVFHALFGIFQKTKCLQVWITVRAKVQIQSQSKNVILSNYRSFLGLQGCRNKLIINQTSLQVEAASRKSSMTLILLAIPSQHWQKGSFHQSLQIILFQMKCCKLSACIHLHSWWKDKDCMEKLKLDVRYSGLTSGKTNTQNMVLNIFLNTRVPALRVQTQEKWMADIKVPICCQINILCKPCRPVCLP